VRPATRRIAFRTALQAAVRTAFLSGRRAARSVCSGPARGQAERAAAAAALLPGPVGVAADAGDEVSVARGADQAWSRPGGLDLLVNNAGLGMRTVNPRFMAEPQGFWDAHSRNAARAATISRKENGCRRRSRRPVLIALSKPPSGAGHGGSSGAPLCVRTGPDGSLRAVVPICRL
jgi:NAD(P)-dependent dehydrogenase (short-subunit alcohol dehydrogenase family)